MWSYKTLFKSGLLSCAALATLFMVPKDVHATTLVVPQKVEISLQRPSDTENVDPILVMRSGVNEEECNEARSLITRIELAGRTLAVKIGGYKEIGRTAASKKLCAVSKVRMDPAVLKEAKVNKVEFTVGSEKSIYALQMSESVVRLAASKQVTKVVPDKTFKNVVDALYYWRLPQKTVAIFARDNRDPYIEKEIERFARQKGLVPVNEILDGYVPRYKEKDRFLFVDNDGTVFEDVQVEDYKTLGSISFERVVKSADKRKNKIFTERIYAKKISALD